MNFYLAFICIFIVFILFIVTVLWDGMELTTILCNNTNTVGPPIQKVLHKRKYENSITAFILLGFVFYSIAPWSSEVVQLCCPIAIATTPHCIYSPAHSTCMYTKFAELETD